MDIDQTKIKIYICDTIYLYKKKFVIFLLFIKKIDAKYIKIYLNLFIIYQNSLIVELEVKLEYLNFTNLVKLNINLNK